MNILACSCLEIRCAPPQSTPSGREPPGRLRVLLWLICLASTIWPISGRSLSAAEREEVLWFENARVTPQADFVLRALREAQVHGLRPRDYELRLTTAELNAVSENEADARTRVRFETALSDAASRFIRDLHHGRVDPRHAGFELPAPSRHLDVPLALRQLSKSRDVAGTLASFEPNLRPYQRLKAALAEYRALDRRPMLTQLPALPDRSIEPGDAYRGAEQLRHLLVAFGDLAPEEEAALDDEGTVDIAMAQAIRRFQRRHGLEVDGVIGPRTYAALTTPLSERVLQLELSMERWRWLNALGRPNIVVNIPQFMLFALPRTNQGADKSLEMRVIVGETTSRSRTPVFTTRITQVVFQPYWDVPRGILTRELLPRIRANESYLDRNDMEIVRGQGDDAPVVAPSPSALDALAAGTLRLRQRPGPKNALGPVKFVMPNPYSIYLHATPERALFERSQRTFSHGCIRVSEPGALASYVLEAAGQSWDEAAIEAALCGTQTLRVRLEQPVQVVVFYTTAAATRSDGVLFLQDVYGHDSKLRQLLGAVTQPRSSSPES